MPSEAEHLSKAKNNEGFAESLSLDTHTHVEWALVALFYSALHYVEAYYERAFGGHAINHESRNKFISMDAALKRVYVEYRELNTLGWTARYKPMPCNQKTYLEAKPLLAAIKKAVGY